MKTVAFYLSFVFCLFLPVSVLAGFGLTTATDYYTVDTGAGLVFKVRRTDNGVSTQSAGDLMSLVYNGVEYQDQSRGTQLNSGFDYLYTGVSAVSVDAAVVNTDYIKVTVVAGNLTHYYMARNGYPHIYMATYFTTEPDTLGLCRFIVRIPWTLLPNGPIPSDIRDNTGAVESSDIFGLADGTTRSKHYSNMRLKDWSYIGATGTNVGIWVVRDNYEGGSGGPFYRCLLNQGADDQEITYIINYGEAQTEAFRTSILNGPYTLVFTNGATPPPLDTSWVANMGLTGFVPTSGRGGVTGTAITGRDTNYAYTVGLSNATAQYSTDVAAGDGSFTKTGMIPGTYTLSVYKNELAVYTASVTVAAGSTTTLPAIAITADPSQTVPLWRIGNWDGSPMEFLNGDKITTMHPSDVRMSAWNPGTYIVGASVPATGMPCYQWKSVNANQVVQFNLTAAQVVASTVRVGITTAYAGGRPNIMVNSTTTALQNASTQPSTRTLTIGSYRGNNTTYTFDIPASALVVGTNTLTVYPISGSSGVTYLSPGYSLDCIDMIQSGQALATPMAPASLAASGGDARVTLNWAASAGATNYTVLRATTSGGPYEVIAPGLTTTSCTDAGLTNGRTYYYVVTASNGSGTSVFSVQASATPAAIPAPVISSVLSAATQVGQNFNYQITATNSPTSFAASDLPSGLSIATASGVISGAATQAGTYNVILVATNSGGAGAATLALVVSAVPAVAPVVTSLTNTSAQVGSPFTYQITATHNPLSYSASGLPDGLQLDTVTGLISGIPTLSGTYSLTVSAANAAGNGSASLTLTIVGIPTVSFVSPGGSGRNKTTVVGGGPKLKILVMRTGDDLSEPLIVRYKTAGDAVPGADYKLLSGIVTIPTGSASAKIKVRAYDDGVANGTKMLKLKLMTDASYNFGDISKVKIEILDVESIP